MPFFMHDAHSGFAGVRKEFHNDCPQLLLRKENSANRGKTDEWYQRGDKRYKFRVMGFPAE
jgi:hypothetical protein